MRVFYKKGLKPRCDAGWSNESYIRQIPMQLLRVLQPYP
jgi:hypothetical protein